MDWQLNVAVIPARSVPSGDPSALPPQAELPATLFVGSLGNAEAELRQTGWVTEWSVGPGASLLARGAEGNPIEFVEHSAEAQ